MLKRVLSLPAVDQSKIEQIESDVRSMEEPLAQAELERFRKESDVGEREKGRNGLAPTTDVTADEEAVFAGGKNELKCIAIVKALAELAKKNPGKVVGLQFSGRRGKLHIGASYTDLSLPDDPSYKSWCFFIDELYKALSGDSHFYWSDSEVMP